MDSDAPASADTGQGDQISRRIRRRDGVDGVDGNTLSRRARRAAWLAAAILSASVTLALTSCAADPGEEMTPQESRDAFMKIVQDTSVLLAEDGWSEVSPPSWGPCSLGSGEGANVIWTYAHEPLTDHVESAKAVADYWSSLGMKVETITEPNISVYATGGGAKGVAFHTAPGSYSISGTSLCAPGDSLELMRAEQANK